LYLFITRKLHDIYQSLCSVLTDNDVGIQASVVKKQSDANIVLLLTVVIRGKMYVSSSMKRTAFVEEMGRVQVLAVRLLFYYLCGAFIAITMLTLACV
jgi:hypothetical protein